MMHSILRACILYMHLFLFIFPLTGFADNLVNLSLIDHNSGKALSNAKVIAYEVDETGEKSWYRSHYTDENGQAQFDLTEVEQGKRYIFSTKFYNQYRSFSQLISNAGSHQFAIGKLTITITDGTLPDTPLLKNKKVVIRRKNPEGKSQWYSSGYTDEYGQLKINLQPNEAGYSYFIAAKSEASGHYKYTGEVPEVGHFDFKVGNPPLVVSLIDQTNGQKLTEQKVMVRKLNPDGSSSWHTNGVTDSQGQVVFDLDNFAQGQQYVLNIKAFNNYTYRTETIVEPGSITLKLATNTIQVKNGNVATKPPIADSKVYIYTVSSDNKRKYYSHATTDENGLLKLDFPQLLAGKKYQLSVNSVASGQKKYSEIITEHGASEFLVGTLPLNVKLRDGLNNSEIPDTKINVYRINSDGSSSWYTSKNTDPQGNAVFDLENLSSDTQYKLTSRVFDNFTSRSIAISSPGEFEFKVGKIALTMKDGSTSNHDILAGVDVHAYLVENNKLQWRAKAKTDLNGIARLDLDNVSTAQSYIFKAKSPSSGQNKYSNAITQNGNHEFIVGDIPVHVALYNYLTSASYPDTKVSVYQEDSEGKLSWYTNAFTDQQGQLVLDLEGLAQGKKYRLKTKVFTSGSAYSDLITTSGSFNFAVGKLPVHLIDKATQSSLANKKVTIYKITDTNSIKWVSSGHTSESGVITFDPLNILDGQRYVLKASSPFGEGKSYYGPVINAPGQLLFEVNQGDITKLDLESPEMNILSPNTQSIANAGFWITGEAFDNEFVNRIELKITDNQTGTHFPEVSLNEQTGLWQAFVESHWLTKDMSVSITATAFDYALNIKTVNKQYLVEQDDLKPQIKITSHSPNQNVSFNGFTLLGTASDNIMLSEFNATVTDPLLGITLNDIALQVDEDSQQWRLVVTGSAISENVLLNIELMARDNSGNTETVSIDLNTVELQTQSEALIRRITFGMTPSLLAQADAGVDILQLQLEPDQIDDTELEAKMAQFDINSLTDLRAYYLSYMMSSKKQLREVMTWFWENHFNTNFNSHQNVAFEFNENNAFRSNALGRFRDLLGVSAKSPAMIYYLSNATNVKGAANENYAREVMELHTLGIDGDYTATDVAALARIFTGWHEQNGAFFFNAEQHDDGDKVFLDNTIIGSGVEEGEQVLDILASHPNTAVYICNKLINFFVSENIDANLSALCATQFQQTDGDISAVLELLLNSEQFVTATENPALFKTPLELITSTVRSLEADYDAYQLSNELNAMSMGLFTYPVPTGFSDNADDWLSPSSFSARLKFINKMVWQQTGDQALDLQSLLMAQGINEADPITDYLFDLLLAGQFNEFEYNQARNLINNFNMQDEQASIQLKRLLGTLLSYPNFQFQ